MYVVRHSPIYTLVPIRSGIPYVSHNVYPTPGRPPYAPTCRILGTITLLDNNRFEVSVYTVTLVSVYTFMVVCTHGI